MAHLISFDKIREAFMEGVDYCKIYGLNWKEHLRPIHENGQLAGYHVLDETKSTSVKTIRL